MCYHKSVTEIQKQDLLKTIERAVDKCQKCRLKKWRTCSVPGAGSHCAKVVFVGEAPGYHEDKQGLPFVGRAGQLLDQLLRENGLGREDVWIGNVIKCRPPDNRDPMVDELRACTPYLEKQIETINPKVIVTLGRFAMNYYIKEGTITQNHGKLFRVGNYLVLPLYHPAAALRNSQVLDILKRDFRIINAALSGSAEAISVNKKTLENENQLQLV
jgi:DNA polymerase